MRPRDGAAAMSRRLYGCIDEPTTSPAAASSLGSSASSWCPVRRAFPEFRRVGGVVHLSAVETEDEHISIGLFTVDDGGESSSDPAAVGRERRRQPLSLPCWSVGHEVATGSRGRTNWMLPEV